MAGKAKNRDQEIGEITRALKRVAMELNVPIVTGAQLNRETEKNEAAMPSLANLRESGNIEQDADLVMFLYRPWYYGMKKELARKVSNKTDDSIDIKDEKRLDVIVAKQRNGSTGSVILNYDLNHQTIEDRR
jgi:replicative DNA helicase